jgi:hypothetical protein
MLHRLDSRVRALEKRVPEAAERQKEPFPAWLMDEWVEGGLCFDRSDSNSIEGAFRSTAGLLSQAGGETLSHESESSIPSGAIGNALRFD